MSSQPFNSLRTGGKGDSHKGSRPTTPGRKPKAMAWTIDFDEVEEPPKEVQAFPVSERPSSSRAPSFKFFHSRGSDDVTPPSQSLPAVIGSAPQTTWTSSKELIFEPEEPIIQQAPLVRSVIPSAVATKPNMPTNGPSTAETRIPVREGGKGNMRSQSPGMARSLSETGTATAVDRRRQSSQPQLNVNNPGKAPEVIMPTAEVHHGSARSASSSVGYSTGRSSASEGAVNGQPEPADIPTIANHYMPLPAEPPVHERVSGPAPRRVPQPKPKAPNVPQTSSQIPLEMVPSQPRAQSQDPTPSLLQEARRQEMEYKRKLIEARQRELAIAQKEEELRREAQRLEELRTTTLAAAALAQERKVSTPPPQDASSPGLPSPVAMDASSSPASPVQVVDCRVQPKTSSPPVTVVAGPIRSTRASSPVHYPDYGSAAVSPVPRVQPPTSPLQIPLVGDPSHVSPPPQRPPSPDPRTKAIVVAQADNQRKMALKKQREEQKRKEEEERAKEEERAWAEAQQKMEEMAKRKEEQKRAEAERRRKADERKQLEKQRLEEAKRQEEERKEAERAQRQEQMRLQAERRREEEKQRARQKRLEEEKRKARAQKEEVLYRQSPPRGTKAHPTMTSIQDPITGQWRTVSPLPAGRRASSPDPTPPGTQVRGRSPTQPPSRISQQSSPVPDVKGVASKTKGSPPKPYPVASPYAVESPFERPVTRVCRPLEPSDSSDVGSLQANVPDPTPAVSRPRRSPSVTTTSQPGNATAWQIPTSKPAPPTRAPRSKSPVPRNTPAAPAVVSAPVRSRSVDVRPAAPVSIKPKGVRAAKGESLCNLSVCVRFRPPPSREGQEPQEMMWLADGNTVCTAQVRPDKLTTNDKAVFVFENVFVEEETTGDVYDHMCRTAVEGAVRGTNSTVFAYGQTNSGKTYTIGGGPGIAGVIEMAALNIFHLIGEQEALGGEGGSYKVHTSYVEIYNEQLSDLLRAPKARKTCPLTILDGPAGVVVDNLLVLPVETPEQVLNLKRRGESYRHVDSNNEHAYASRSHTIFQFHIERVDFLGPNGPSVTKSVLNIVDLAGSEATYQPFKTDGRHNYDPMDRDVPSSFGLDRSSQQRRHDFQKQHKEGNNIRCSLLALMRVVRALASRLTSKDPNMHIPYRDSKLTRMLSDAVGGNSETVLICTINPTEYRETLATLHFAAIAQQVRGTPKPVTVPLASNEALMQYRGEIDKLRALLDNERQRQADIDAQCEEHDRKEECIVKYEYIHVMQEMDEKQREEIVAAERERFAQQLEEERQRHQLEMQEAVHRLRSASAQLEIEQQKREQCVQELAQKLEAAETEIEEQRMKSAVPLSVPDQTEAAEKQKEAEAQLEALQQQWAVKAEELEAVQREQSELQRNAKALQEDLQQVAQEREAMLQYIRYKQAKGEKGFGSFVRKVFGKSKSDPQPWERFMPARPPTVVAPSSSAPTAPRPLTPTPGAPAIMAAPTIVVPSAPHGQRQQISQPQEQLPQQLAAETTRPPSLDLPAIQPQQPEQVEAAASSVENEASSSDDCDRIIYPDAAPSPVKAQAHNSARSDVTYDTPLAAPIIEPYWDERPPSNQVHRRSPPSSRHSSMRSQSPLGDWGPRYPQRHSVDWERNRRSYDSHQSYGRDTDYHDQRPPSRHSFSHDQDSGFQDRRPPSRQAFPQYGANRRPQETPSPVRHRTPTSGFRQPPQRTLSYGQYGDGMPDPWQSSDVSFEEFERLLR